MATKEKDTVKTADKNKAEEKKLQNKAEDKKAEEKKTESAEDAEEVNADDLFKHRESITMTPENSWFSLSAGGLISLKIINAEGNEEFFERVVIRRSFPVTAPDEFLSVREPDSRIKGRGAEIGMIRNVNIFDKDTVKLITSAKEKFGYTYWEAETTAGNASIVLNNPFSNIRVLEDMRIFISDMDGNCFVIPDPSKLDKLSYKYIEIYI